MNERDSSGQQQRAILTYEQQRIHAVCNAFAEIQAGPNPLSPEEIETLSRLRPQYAILSRKR
jgi:hypothetical protein